MRRSSIDRDAVRRSGDTLIVNNSVTLAMLAQQTPGSILIFDAAGNATVLPDVAVGQVLTSGGVGLPPSYAALPAPSISVLDTQNLVAQGTLTTGAWAANAFSKITIELAGLANAGTPANSDIRIRANADSSAKYGHTVNAHSSANVAEAGAIGTPTSALIAYLNTTTTKTVNGTITIFPKTATNRMRGGQAQIGTFPASATVSEYYGTEGSFTWSDTTTDWTFATILFGSASTFTGTMITRGYP